MAARCLCSRCFQGFHVGETPSNQKNHRLKYIVYKTNKKYYEISLIYKCIELNSIIIGNNIWMVSFKSNLIIYDLNEILQLREFVWTLWTSVWVVFNHFLLLGATDRSKISSDHHQFDSTLVYTPFNFSQTLPLSLLWTLPLK